MNSYQVSALKPFGLIVTPPTGKNRELIPPSGLDQMAKREKLVVLRGFDELDRDGFLEYCARFPNRRPLHWDFGPVMEMKETPHAKNYLFSREKVPFHWDGAFHDVPTYLMFYCVEAPHPGSGGETLFCNTEMVWADVLPEDKLQFSGVELKYETKKVAHYGGVAEGPLVQSHPYSGKPILRFAEPVKTALNPVSLEIKGIPRSNQSGFVHKLQERIYDSAYCYGHRWEKNDILIADNHSLIHGRTAFKQDCPRHLRRIQLI